MQEWGIELLQRMPIFGRIRADDNAVRRTKCKLKRSC